LPQADAGGPNHPHARNYDPASQLRSECRARQRRLPRRSLPQADAGRPNHPHARNYDSASQFRSEWIFYASVNE
jgi:hypothetical protein